MPLYRDDAVVLRTRDLGEADRVITLLGRSRGRIDAVAKGVRRTTSKFGARLEPFTVVDAQFFEGRSLDIVTQADSVGAYGARIAPDYDRYTAASAMVETADRLAQRESNPAQFVLLVGGLRALASAERDPWLIADSYLLRALALAGWAPSFDACVRCGRPGPHHRLHVAAGGVLCETCAPQGSVHISDGVRSCLAALLSGSWQTLDVSSSRDRRGAHHIVEAYAQYVLDRPVRSFRQLVAQ